MSWFSKDKEIIARSYTVRVNGLQVTIDQADEVDADDNGSITFKRDGRIVGYFAPPVWFIEN
jgi:hypothetical protein